jgi:hypothetical protein
MKGGFVGSEAMKKIPDGDAGQNGFPLAGGLRGI